MKKCPICNEELADNVRFCSFCGHPFNETAPAAAPVPQAGPEPFAAPASAPVQRTPVPAAQQRRMSPLPFIGFGLGVLAVILCAVPVLSILLAIAGLVVSIIGCRSRNKLYGFAVAGIPVALLAFLLAAIVGGLSAAGRVLDAAAASTQLEETVDTTDETEEPESIPEDESEAEPETEAEAETEPETAADSSAEPAAAAETSGKDYEIVGEYSYVDSIGTTHFLKVVTANRDEQVNVDVVVKDADGKVVGTMEDFVYLEAGDTGVLTYSDFELDESLHLSDLTFEITYSAEDNWLFQPHSSAFEVTDYNSSGDELYVTVTQTEDTDLAFPKVQALFFNGDQLVDYEYSYAELDGAGSEDILEMWVYGVNYDSVELYTVGY